MILALVLVGLLTIGGCAVAAVLLTSSSSRDDEGEIVEGGDLEVFDLEVGDCFRDPTEDGGTDTQSVESVEAIPCDEPHDAEVYANVDVSSEGPSFPGGEQLTALAEDRCLEEFEPYVGTTYEQSEYTYGWLVPSEQSWDDLGDREINCVLYTMDGATTTGSGRGSGR